MAAEHPIDPREGAATSRSIPEPAEPLDRMVVPLWAVGGMLSAIVAAWWWRRLRRRRLG